MVVFTNKTKPITGFLNAVKGAIVRFTGNAFLLQETGFYLLLEDGFRIVLQEPTYSPGYKPVTTFTNLTKN